jgi:hypothetical protein
LKKKSDREFFDASSIMENLDLSVPWAPRLDGAVVPILELVSELVVKRVEPSEENNAGVGWTARGLTPSLARNAPERAALLESMIALWRLKKVEGTGLYDVIWRDHFVAWMVR